MYELCLLQLVSMVGQILGNVGRQPNVDINTFTVARRRIKSQNFYVAEYLLLKLISLFFKNNLNKVLTD
jgi:hypothetical protein